MLTTVYFATNRTLDGPAEDWSSYGTAIRIPSDPGAITYAVAFVGNTDLTADTTGAIQQISDVQQGGFSQSAVDDLSVPGRNCWCSSMVSTTASRMRSPGPASFGG